MKIETKLVHSAPQIRPLFNLIVDRYMVRVGLESFGPRGRKVGLVQMGNVGWIGQIGPKSLFSYDSVTL